MEEIEKLKCLGQETVDKLNRRQNEAAQKEAQRQAQVSCIHLCSMIKLVLTPFQEQANANQARVSPIPSIAPVRGLVLIFLQIAQEKAQAEAVSPTVYDQVRADKLYSGQRRGRNGIFLKCVTAIYLMES